MKQKLLLGFGFLFACFFAWAQPANTYVVEASTATPYQEISDGTPIGTQLYGKDFDAKSILSTKTGVNVDVCEPIGTKGFQIGFPFQWCNQTYTTFTINTRGLLYLGGTTAEDSIFPGFAYTGFYGNACENTMRVIGNLYSDTVMSLQTSDQDPVFTQISYKLEGTTVGSRVLVVQFKNILIRTAANYYDTLNYQIRLSEDKTFQIAYKNAQITAPKPLSLSFQIGLKNNKTDLSLLSAFDDWTKVTKSASVWNKNMFSAKVYPAPNLVYTFSPPPACVASNPPSDFVSSDILSTGLSFAFTKEAKADGYLVLQSTERILDVQPQAGITYSKDDLLGNAKVIGFAATDKYTLSELQPSTQYQYHIFSYNNQCSGPILYSTTPLRDSVRTLFGAPSLKTMQRDTHSITLQLTANKEKHTMVIALYSADEYVQASPKGKLQVGDTLSNGAKVIYKGSASEFKIQNLIPNGRYWITAWSVDGSDTVYSSTSSQIGERTWSKLPAFFGFNGEKQNEMAAGWSTIIKNLPGSPYYKVAPIAMVGNDCELATYVSEGEFTQSDAMSPSVVFESGKHRLFFGFTSKVPGPMMGNVGYKLTESDSLLVQITENGVDFKTLYTLNSTNYTLSSTAVQERSIEITGYDNKIVNFRFVYYSPHRSISSITYLKVEKIFSCDYVSRVFAIDSTITTHSAALEWINSESSDLTPTSWNLSYKAEFDTTWSPAQNVTSFPGILSGLVSQSALQARVQAVCEGNIPSIWSAPSPIFYTKYAMPLFVDFESDLWLDGKFFPAYWTGTKSLFADKDSVTFPVLTDNASDWNIRKWKQNANTKAINCNFPANASSWFFTPVMDLGADENNLLLSFDFALAPRWQTGGLDSVNSQARFLVVLSTDGGKTYTKSNILKAYGAGSPNKLGNLDSVHESILLKGQSGKIAIGFYVENTGKASANSCIYVDNINLDYTCPMATNLTSSHVGEDSAMLSWTSSDKSSQWLLRYRTQDQTNYSYQTTDIPSITLKSLAASTPYQWGVLSLCAANDSSRWTTNTFTTLTPYVCDTITNSRVIRSALHEVDLIWKGEAHSYTFAYRKFNTTDWIQSKIDTTKITLSQLQEGTKYEYKIQAQCTADTTDHSLWTSPKYFTTQYVTCPAPENFHIIKPTFESVTLVWKSEARAISILIREDNATSWGKEIPSSAKDTIELYGLAANTTYWIRMRMTCAPGDISEWSDSVQCATLNYPSCYPPTNLHAIAITPTSVQLTWTPSQKTYEYNILFKASTAAKYDTTIGHFATIYTINNLKANTAYTWQVQSRCAQLLYSQYSNASNFTTLPISLESSTDFKKGFTVYSQNGQIHIVNLQNQRIEQVEILSLEGKLLGNYPIHNSDHILIPTNLQNTMVLIRLQTVKGSIVYKNLVK